MTATLQHHAISIRAITADDVPEVQRILSNHDDVLTVERRVTWRWPPGAWGFIAEHHGRPVAFMAIRMTEMGVAVDELWDERSRPGLRGMRALADMAERWAHDAGCRIGGMVEISNRRHMDALAKRGYKAVAVVMAKESVNG